MRRLRAADGGTRPRRRCRHELPALRGAPYRAADSTKSVPPSNQKHRPPNERSASSIPLSAPADSTRGVVVDPRSVRGSIYYHRRGDAGSGSLSRINPRRAEASAGGIDGGTQCAGDQHRNLFAALFSFLDNPASFLSRRVNLEFASSQRSSHSHSSSCRRLRPYGVFAAATQALAFLLSKGAATLPRIAGEATSCKPPFIGNQQP